ncbi:MAG: YjdF family protein [Oscillospiraceae bacterium]|nr:YjdF family protein [Oscillospiraceae bacterium]
MEARLTVYFDDPFWVGVFERVEDGKLSVCKVTFGAEPKDYEVWEFVLEHYYKLEFSPSVETNTRRKADNPKRRQRNARKQLEHTGVGTKSQQALQMQLEKNKQERKVKNREQKLAEEERLFALKQQKKKEKHRGR